MDDRTPVLERRFAASPERVYAAWTDPAALPRWFGPDGFTCKTHAIDVRVGGEWRFNMDGHGMTFSNRHRWTALEPHSRIAYLLDGGDGTGEPKEVEVRLHPDGSGTRLVQTMTFPAPEGVAEARGYGAEEKGQETLAKLAQALGE